MRITAELECIVLHLALKRRCPTTAIADELGLSRTTVWRIIVRHRPRLPRARGGTDATEPGRES